MNASKIASALRAIADALEEGGGSVAKPTATPAADPAPPTATKATRKPAAKAEPLKTSAEAEAALRGLAKDYGQPEGLAVLTELGVKALKDVAPKAEKEPDLYSRIVAAVEARRAELAAAATEEEPEANDDPFGN